MKAAKLQRGFTEKNVLLPEWTKACILSIPSSSPSPVMLTARSGSKLDNQTQDWKRQKIPAEKCLEFFYFEHLTQETGKNKKQRTYDQKTSPHIPGTSRTIPQQKEIVHTWPGFWGAHVQKRFSNRRSSLCTAAHCCRPRTGVSRSSRGVGSWKPHSKQEQLVAPEEPGRRPAAQPGWPGEGAARSEERL